MLEKLIPDRKLREAIEYALTEDADARDGVSQLIKGSLKPGELVSSLHRGTLVRLVRGVVVGDHVKTILRSVKDGQNIRTVIEDRIKRAGEEAKRLLDESNAILSGPVMQGPKAVSNSPTSLPIFGQQPPAAAPAAGVKPPNIKDGPDYDARNLFELEAEGHQYFADRFNRLLNPEN